MGYSIFFDFVKDSEIDPSLAFKQNIVNFQKDLSRVFIKEGKETDRILFVLFKEIKSLILSEEYNLDIVTRVDLKGNGKLRDELMNKFFRSQ